MGKRSAVRRPRQARTDVACRRARLRRKTTCQVTRVEDTRHIVGYPSPTLQSCALRHPRDLLPANALHRGAVGRSRRRGIWTPSRPEVQGAMKARGRATRARSLPPTCGHGPALTTLIDGARGVRRGPGCGVRPEVVTTGRGALVGTFKDLGGQRATAPQCQFYLDSKLVRGLENEGLTIGVTPFAASIVWGGDRWMRSMELQFP